VEKKAQQCPQFCVGECTAAEGQSSSRPAQKVPLECFSELSSFYSFHTPSCWRQLTLTWQAMRHPTGHLKWPLFKKEVAGLHTAVSGTWELNGEWTNKRCTGCAMQSSWCGCLQGSLCKHTGTYGPGAHGEMVTWGSCKQGQAGMGSRQRQANKAWQMRTRDTAHSQVGS